MSIHCKAFKVVLRKYSIKSCPYFTLVPRVGTEVSLRRQFGKQSRLASTAVDRRSKHVVTPPADRFRMILYGEEDNNAGECDTASESRREDIVVLFPPWSLVPLQVEHESRRTVETTHEISKIDRGPEQESIEDK